LYDFATREAQYRALLSMPSVEIQYAQSGRVELIEGSTALFPAVKGLREGDKPDQLLRLLGPMLMATPLDGLRVRSLEDRKVRSEGFESGGYDVFLEQTINGLPVIDANVNLRTAETGELVVVSSRFVPAAGVSSIPALKLAGVKEIVLRDLVAGGLAAEGSVKLAAEGQLGYWTDNGQLDRPVLVWMLQARYRSSRDQGERESVQIAADAATGEVRKLQPTSFAMRRIVYSLNNDVDYDEDDNWQQRLLWDEFPPNYGDTQAVAMYNNVQKPRDFWASVGWNYETVNLVAHWGVHDNAQYDTISTLPGVHTIIFGDDVAVDPDTASHEYGHGVYLNRSPSQPGSWWAEWNAINEFYADLSAVFTDMAQRNGAFQDPNTWLIGSINGTPLRDLSNPKNPLVYQAAYQNYRDWYPKRSWCCTRGGIAHQNMTIFGHAFYLLRHGGVHSRAGQRWSSWPTSFSGDTIPTIPVTQISDNTRLKQIFVQALANMKLYSVEMNGTNMKFYTADVANALYGPTLKTNVETAWKAVGISHTCSAPPSRPAYTLWPGNCQGRYRMEWPGQAGVTYHAQVVPALYPWDTYGQTVTDGEVTQCKVNVPQKSRWRMRACNGCGCSAWTPDEYLDYWNICQ
jgi:Zn-dependent metalloprotease